MADERVNPPGGKKRRYEAPARATKAAATRAAILAAARELFTTRGYAATSINEIATRAGVNPDTVYAAVGRKPQLLRMLVETALSGAEHPIPATERDYVAAIRNCPDAAGKLDIYAQAVGAIGERLAPIFGCLAEAATTDADCVALWTEISERRARNMRQFAADLRATGALRADLDDGEVADIVWSMNGPEYYRLLVRQRGWDRARFSAWLADAWRRLLLSDATGVAAKPRQRS